MTVRACVLTAVLVFAPQLVHAQQTPAPPRDESLVVTSGEGIVQAVPDRAWISVTAESRASNARDAQRRNAEIMKPVQDRLSAAGIPADAVKTTGYELQYEWDFVDGKRVGRGYVARNSIEVRIDAIDRVGELLEITVGSGATAVGGIRFDLKDRARLEREAMRLAVVDARGRAEAAAAGAGRTLDRIVRIEERVGGESPVQVRMFALAKEASSDTPPIAAGQIEIRSQVTLTAALK